MRDYKELAEVDVKVSLLKGTSIKVENLIIEPYTLKEIEEYGYTRYMQNLQWISISIDDFISSVEDEGKAKILNKKKDKLKTFDFYYKLGGNEILDMLIGSIKMILKTDDVIALDEGVIAVNFIDKGFMYKDENGAYQFYSDELESISENELTVIHRDNFDDFVEVVKLQNYLKKPEKEYKPNPVDEQAKKLMEQMEENRKKVEAKKRAQNNSNDDNAIDISDIISAVSSKSYSINKFNIWDFTLYQLYDEYTRLELIDNYDFSIRAMMAGVDIKDGLKHWSSRI